MDRQHYIGMCLKILSNSVWYRLIPEGKLAMFYEEFGNISNRAVHVGLIDKNTWNFFFLIKHPVTPTFYMLPKVQKIYLTRWGTP